MTQQIGTRKVSLVEISAREIRDLTSNSNFYPLETHCETEEYFPAPLPPIRWRPHWGRGRAAGPRASPSGSPPLKTVAGRKRRRPRPSVRPSVGRSIVRYCGPNGRAAGRGPSAIRASNGLCGGGGAAISRYSHLLFLSFVLSSRPALLSTRLS